MKIRNWLVGGAAVLGMMSVASPASAYYDVGSAQGAMNGGCLHNQVTHVLTCITGYPKITREVHFNTAPHFRNKNFWVVAVSAQRCDNGSCYGPAIQGRLVPRQGLPGSPVNGAVPYEDPQSSTLSPSDETLVEAGIRQDVCFVGTTVCAAPWNWFGSQVTQIIASARTKVIYPCLNGAGLGFGGALLANGSVRFFLDVGLITQEAADSAWAGPVGAGLVTLTGCTSMIAKNGYNDVTDLWGGR